MRMRLLLIPALLVGLTLTVGPSAAPPASAARILYAVNGRNAITQRTDGTTVVWNWSENDGSTSVYGYTLPGRQMCTVASGAMYREWPDIDGGIVVWSERSLTASSTRRSVVGRDLNTGHDIVVAATGHDDTMPAIKGNLVAWMSWDGTRCTLMGRHVSPLDAPFMLAQLPVGTEPGAPVISGGRVVWGQFVVAGGFGSGNPPTS